MEEYVKKMSIDQMQELITSCYNKISQLEKTIVNPQQEKYSCYGLTMKQAMEYTKKGKDFLEKCIAKQLLPVRRVGNIRYFKKEDLEKIE